MMKAWKRSFRKYLIYAALIVFGLFCLWQIGRWLDDFNSEMNHTFEFDGMFCQERIGLVKGTHLLVDLTNREIIADKTYAVLPVDNQIFALGNGEYIVYDMHSGKEKVYKVTNSDSVTKANKRYEQIAASKYSSYARAERVELSSYDGFSDWEKTNFLTMLEDEHRGHAAYYAPFYKTPYEYALIDINSFARIDEIRVWKIEGDAFYAYGRKHFIIIKGHGALIEEYFSPSLEMSGGIQDERPYDMENIKKQYGKRYVSYTDVNEFTVEEQSILRALWKSYYLARTPVENRAKRESELDNHWNQSIINRMMMRP